MTRSQEKLLRAAVRTVRWQRSDSLLGFAAGLVAGVVGYALVQQQAPAAGHRRGGAPTPAAAAPAPADEAVAAITGGPPPTTTYRRMSDHYVSEYDPATRNPRWVAERLTADNVRGPADRAGFAFREDPALPPLLRARPEDYAGSGYDRGHLAAAANHRGSSAAMGDTFLMSNIAPQVGPGFNRDYWARLERFTRQLAKGCAGSDADGADAAVHVVTGPLYLPRWKPTAAAPAPAAAAGGGGKGAATPAPAGGHWEYRHHALGSPLQWVAVPTHFFKAVLAKGYRGDNSSSSDNSSSTSDTDAALVAAFVLPNAPIPPGTPLTDFLVPLSSLEAAGGLTLFSGDLDEGARDAVDAEAVAVATGGGGGGVVAAAAATLRQLRRVYLSPAAAPQTASGKGGGGKGGGGAYAGPFSPELVPPPLLEAISSGAFSSSSSRRSLSAFEAQLGSSGGSGRRRAVRHLCAVVSCALPSENGLAANGGGDGGSSRHNGAGRAASRPQASAPPQPQQQQHTTPPRELTLETAVSALGDALAADGSKGDRRAG
jgi:endonuclease G, mitochondrial